MARSNCFFFSLAYRARVLRRWREAGRPDDPGYWGMRPTRHILLGGRRIGFHWVYTIDRPSGGRSWHIHYEPIDPVTENDKTWRGTVKAMLHKVWFAGRIRRYDNPWKEMK